MSDWREASMVLPRIGPFGWALALIRGLVLGVITYGCLVVLLLVRLVEWPLFRPARPITPWITQFVCKSAFVVMGLPLTVRGRPMRQKGAVVANHSSFISSQNPRWRAGPASAGWRARPARSLSRARAPRPSASSMSSRTACGWATS
jgi:hypothetical protein